MRRSGLLAIVASMALVAGCGTATLLPDGRVLLLNLVAKAYDPATGRVMNLPMPPTLRVYASATLLLDGKVLIAGGASSLGTGVSVDGSSQDATGLASADLYDPATGTYTPTGDMARPRAFHTATLLADGRVLIQGGGAPAAEQTGAAAPEPNVVPPPEIYDPASGTFGPTNGDTLIPLVLATATLLPDGKVLFAGGQTAVAPAEGATPDPSGTSGAPTAEAELFDPSSGTFSATGSMSDPRVWHTATALQDGRVLIVGGTTNSDVMTSGQAVDPTTQTAEIYDPGSGTFSATGATVAPRMGHAAAVLADGRVLITGGLDTDQETPESFARSAEIYDPAAGTFTATGDMVAAHAFHTATTLADGRVLIAGFGEELMTGMSSDTSPDLLSSAEVYDPATGTFTAVEVEPAVLPSALPSAG